jgi:hypothetical protein
VGIIGSFFGRDQKKDLANAKAQADADLAAGYNDARNDYTTAENYFRPYAEGGQRGQRFYDEALGLYGDEARGAATSSLASNPLFQGQLGQESNAISRVLNAQGNSGGGKAHLAAQRVFQGNAGNWLDRYANRGQQGLQASNQMAQYRSGIGDAIYGNAMARAGNRIQKGNFDAQNSMTGVNNIMGLGSLAISGVNAFNKPKLG